MKTILFCNTKVPNCGVYQYGTNLFAALRTSTRYRFAYLEPIHEGEMCDWVQKHEASAVMFNWHPGQGGWMAGAPFNVDRPVKNLLVFHDWKGNTGKFDAVLISDPTMADHDNWYSIPRPVPEWIPTPKAANSVAAPVIGVHGFGGASADLVMGRVMAEFDHACVRVHLPFAQYGDANGVSALNMARHLLKMASSKPSILVEVSHRFLPQDDLLRWLEQNDLNCYIRDTTVRWEGISSALDAALAVRRPLAINKCQGFRHVHGTTPSVCVEDRSLKEILTTGIEPLKPIYEKNSRDRLIASVEQILAEKGIHGD